MLGAVAEWYTDLMDNQSDQRVKDWIFMSGPLPTACICATYAVFVTKIGPKFMENRKPFELKNTLIVYNFLQVIFSAWLFSEAVHAGWFTTYSFRCQPVDYSNSPLALRTVNGCWWYYFSKFTEFLDTIFFVLRKKNNQITRLHVIHHGIMPLSTWFGVKFTPGGHSTFFGMINTFVHIIMYAYYMLAAMGPHMQKYLWWKKYLTVLQMVQFILVMVHAFQLLFIECDYPKAFVWWIGMHAVMFYFLFKDFYNQAYKKRKMKVDEAEQNGNAISLNNKESSNGLKHRSVNGELNKYHNELSNGKHNGTIINGKDHNGVYTNGVSKSNGVNHNGVTHVYHNGSSNGSVQNGVHKNGTGHNGVYNHKNNT